MYIIYCNIDIGNKHPLILNNASILSSSQHWGQIAMGHRIDHAAHPMLVLYKQLRWHLQLWNFVCKKIQCELVDPDSEWKKGMLIADEIYYILNFVIGTGFRRHLLFRFNR